jgi:hypothetical protein
MMNKEQLIEAAGKIIGDDLDKVLLEKLEQIMTVTQYVTDICLNEIEHRGELQFFSGMPVVPYSSDYGVETILTRGDA